MINGQKRWEQSGTNYRLETSVKMEDFELELYINKNYYFPPSLKREITVLWDKSDTNDSI